MNEFDMILWVRAKLDSMSEDATYHDSDDAAARDRIERADELERIVKVLRDFKPEPSA